MRRKISMADAREAWSRGFAEKCAAAGADPVRMFKYAQAAQPPPEPATPAGAMAAAPAPRLKGRTHDEIIREGRQLQDAMGKYRTISGDNPRTSGVGGWIDRNVPWFGDASRMVGGWVDENVAQPAASAWEYVSPWRSTNPTEGQTGATDPDTGQASTGAIPDYEADRRVGAQGRYNQDPTKQQEQAAQALGGSDQFGGWMPYSGNVPGYYPEYHGLIADPRFRSSWGNPDNYQYGKYHTPYRDSDFGVPRDDPARAVWASK